MKKHLVLCILCTLCCVAYAQKIKAVIYHPTLSRVGITYVYN